jgi:hypothetical protein
MELCGYCLDIINFELPNRDFDEEHGMIPYHHDKIRPHHDDQAALKESANHCLLCETILRSLYKSPHVATYGDLNKPGIAVTKFRVSPAANVTNSRLEMLRHGILAKSVSCHVGDRPLGFMDLLVKRPNLTIHCMYPRQQSMSKALLTLVSPVPSRR